MGIAPTVPLTTAIVTVVGITVTVTITAVNLAETRVAEVPIDADKADAYPSLLSDYLAKVHHLRLVSV